MEAISVRRKRWFRIAVLVLAAGAVAWGCWWVLSPDYFDLNVPVPEHSSGVADIWNEVSRAEVQYPGSSGRDYVVRRVGTVYPDRHQWQSQEDIVASFDQWLTARGWIVRDIYSDGDPVIPETSFLGNRPPGVRQYTRSGDPWGYKYRVVVAVWPIRSGERVLGFNVVLTTIRPSFLRRLQESFD